MDIFATRYHFVQPYGNTRTVARHRAERNNHVLGKIGLFLMLFGIFVAVGGVSLAAAFGYPAALFLFVAGAICYFWRE